MNKEQVENISKEQIEEIKQKIIDFLIDARDEFIEIFKRAKKVIKIIINFKMNEKEIERLAYMLNRVKTKRLKKKYSKRIRIILFSE